MKCTSKSAVAVWTLIPSLLLTACATPPAPDFGGRWRPVNRFASATEAIPLYQSYVYQASPMDGTLKNMLDRWAKDSGMTLSYLHPSDFRLHSPVAAIHTGDLNDAALRLSEAYAQQQVSVSVSGNQLIVRMAEPTQTQ